MSDIQVRIEIDEASPPEGIHIAAGGAGNRLIETCEPTHTVRPNVARRNAA
jgi:hypothetical protein